MDKYMKQIASAYEYKDHSDFLWQYTNSLGEILRVGRHFIEIIDETSKRRIEAENIISLELSKNWKSSPSGRTIFIHCSGAVYQYQADTSQGRYLDIVTVFRQLCRSLRSNGANFIER
jgi:hypothetical protein